MSFSSPLKPPRYYQPKHQINVSSPNLYTSLKKSDINIQHQKDPPIPPNLNPYSPTKINQTYGQMSKDFYTSNTSKQFNSAQTGNKLTEMTSDLAKLKQQLSKIMNQAGKMQKRPVSTIQQNVRTSQQVNLQSFTKPQSGEQMQAKSVNQINKSLQRKQISFQGKTKSSQNRVAQNNKIQVQQSPTIPTKLAPTTPDGMEYRAQKQIDNQKDKSPRKNISKLTEYSTSQDLNNLGSQSRVGNQIFAHQNSAKVNQQENLREKYHIAPVSQSREEFFSKSISEKSVNGLKKSKNSFILSEQKSKSPQKPIIFIQAQTKNKSPTKTDHKYASPERPVSQNLPIQTKKLSQNYSRQIMIKKVFNQQISQKTDQKIPISHLKTNNQQQDYQYRQKIIELEHEKRKLKHQINSLQVEKQSLQMTLNTQKAQKQALNKKYIELEELFKSVKFELEQSKTRYKLLQRKLEGQTSRPKVLTENFSFDQVLKQQMAEIIKLKQQIDDKDEQIMRVKEFNTSQRRQIESLHNQIKIEQLKAASQLKESEQKSSISIQDKENEIKTMKNLVITLQAKLDCAIKENKTKDAFMIQHLTGKLKSGEQKDYIQNFFNSYRIDFPTNKIANKLKEEQKEIERLKKTILQMGSNKA